MMEPHCFAYRNGYCKALKVRRCQGEGCPFFKTKARAVEEQKKVFARIRLMDPASRKNIMTLYYGGKMSLLDETEV